MDIVFLIISTICFLGGILLSIALLRSGKSPSSTNLIVIALGFLFQCLFLWKRGELHGRCPITSGAEIFVFISWSMSIMYFILGRAFRLSLLGMFTAPIVFFFQAGAILSLLVSDSGPKPLEHVDPWLEMHASMSVLAYGAFALAAVAGVMYFVQNRQLKSRHPGRLSRNLPPIKYLSDALIRLLVIGLVLISIGIVSSFFMERSPSLAHLAASGAVWVIYCAILLVHLVRRQSPRTLAVCGVVAFGFALATLLAI